MKYMISALLGLLIGRSAFDSLLGIPLHAGLEFRLAAIVVAVTAGAELYRRLLPHPKLRDITLFVLLLVFAGGPESFRLLLSAAALGGFLVVNPGGAAIFGLFLTLGLTGIGALYEMNDGILLLLALLFGIDRIRFYRSWKRGLSIVFGWLFLGSVVIANLYLAPYQNEPPRRNAGSASLALPSALMANSTQMRMLLVSGTGNPSMLPIWNALPFVQQVDFLKHSGSRAPRQLPPKIRLYHGSPQENGMTIGRRQYDFIFLENLPEASPYQRKLWIQQLTARLRPGGVLVLPRPEIPPLNYQRSVPGSRGRYVAWSDALSLTNDLSRLDDRLERLQEQSGQSIMPPGMLECLYEPEMDTELLSDEYVAPEPPGDLHYFARGGALLLGVLYFLLRLYAGRYGNNPVRLSIFENSFCFTLIWFALLEMMPIPLTYGIAAAGLWFVAGRIRYPAVPIVLLGGGALALTLLGAGARLPAFAVLTPMAAFFGGALQRNLAWEMREESPSRTAVVPIFFSAIGMLTGIVISVLLNIYSPAPGTLALLLSAGFRLPWLLGL